SEKKTEGKKGKNREAPNKHKPDDLDVRVHDFKGSPESDPVPNSEGKIFKSQRQTNTCMGKTTKDALRQGFPKQKKDTSWNPEAEQLMLSESGLETEASNAEQCKTKVIPSGDLPMSSAGHQQEQTVSQKKNLKSSKNLQSASKASQNLVHEKQTSKQKFPKDIAAQRLEESPRKKLKKSGKKSSNKKPQLKREKSSHGEAGEEELEREPVKLHEVFNSPLHQIHCRTSKGVCSSPEDTEAQMDSDSFSVQDVARKKQKLSYKKIKSNKRKHNMQHGLHGPVLEHCDKFDSRSRSYEQDNTSSDNSEGLNCQVRDLLSDSIAKSKIVMPSNTPNVRRTKRIRLRPLEYWRGERANYAVTPSGGMVVSGIVHPKTQPRRKIKRRKGGEKQKRDETRSEIPINLQDSLADTSKPAVVLDPETNEEVLLDCVNTGSSNSCCFKDESIEIYKNLNTFAFATGRLILKPFKEKGYQFVHMDTIAFHVMHGKIIVTLHKSSYYLTAGDYFYVPAGNGYNIRNLLNEESVLFFTQLKD
ncbi:CENPC protein, partial [Podargus strigoides]|nr:CENPC protein [Podargus strigoides]